MAERNDNEGAGMVTLDDLEQQDAAGQQAGPDLTKIVVDGADVPEIAKGKSVADVVKQLNGLQQALKISEDARLALANSSEALRSAASQPAPAPAPAPAPVLDEIDSMTEDQLRELHSTDPFKAQQIMIERSQRRLERNLQQRVGSLASSTASAAESQARTKYADDFEVIGPEINNFVNSLPDKTVLAQPGAWDELITYVRGKHVTKYIDARIKKADQDREAALNGARQQQAEAAPANLSGGASSQPRGGRVTQLDAVQKEIARVQGISEEDYIKFSM